MKLIEADGKRILKEAGISVPLSFFPNAIASFPVYVKAQVLQGRRGQRGLVRSCANVEEVERALREMMETLGPAPHAGFLYEAGTPHGSEWLAAIHLDHAGNVVASFSDRGGIEVSEAQTRPVTSTRDIDGFGLPAGVADTLKKMFEAFSTHDALHLEINPLAVLADGSCVALDAKVELDDAAAFRHPEWQDFAVLSQTGKSPSEREVAYSALLENAGHRGTLGRYVELDGDIAMILSGGGASLVAIDALIAAGGRPANYVEMSGNPDPETVRAASRVVFSKPGLRAVWIAGSFANFTDIQATVNAVLAALDESGLRIPVVIRRDGPNADAARADALKWGTDHGITVRFDRADVDLDASAQAVVL